MRKKIAFAGGGTAGHVIPNLALIEELEDKYDIIYIGSNSQMEKNLIEPLGIKYYSVSTGKLRRYFDIKNVTDAVNVLRGIRESQKILKEEKPDLLFSKGGFAAVPVVLAARNLKIPIISHESDMTPGLANKISIPYSRRIACNFEATLKFLPKHKAFVSGCPIRKFLYEGNSENCLKKYNLEKRKTIFILGGSSGSSFINRQIRKNLEYLLPTYNVIHQCGYKHTIDLDNIELSDKKLLKNYVQLEYIDAKELADIYSFCDIVISRSGANAIFELLGLKKPMLLIPLSKRASRGDQILNAEVFENKGFASVLQEDEIIEDSDNKKFEIANIYNEDEISLARKNNILLKKIDETFARADDYINHMSETRLKDSKQIIIEEIEKII